MSSPEAEHELYVVQHKTASEALWKLALFRPSANRCTLIFSDLVDEFSTIGQGERSPRRSHNQNLSSDQGFATKVLISSLKSNEQIENFWDQASKPLGQSNRHYLLHVLALLEGSKIVPDGTYGKWRATLQPPTCSKIEPCNRSQSPHQPSAGPQQSLTPRAGQTQRLAPVASPIPLIQPLGPDRGDSGADSPATEPRSLARLRARSPRRQASSPGNQPPSPSHSSRRSGSQRQPSADRALSLSAPRADEQTPPSRQPSAQRRQSSVQPPAESEDPPEPRTQRAPSPILSNAENNPPPFQIRLRPINVRVPSAARPLASRHDRPPGQRVSRGGSSRATDRFLCSEDIDLFSPRSQSYPPNVFIRRQAPATSGASAANNAAQPTNPASPTAGIGRGRRSVRIANGVPGDSNTTSSLPSDNLRSRGPSPSSRADSSPAPSGAPSRENESESSSPSTSPETGAAATARGAAAAAVAAAAGEGANCGTPKPANRMPSAVTPRPANPRRSKSPRTRL